MQKAQFDPVENVENVWKQIHQIGNDKIIDTQSEDSPWKGKPRSIIYEFLFSLTGEGEPISNQDEEDPEEFVVSTEGSTNNKNEGYLY